jgi:hypothetical protein
MEPTIIVAIIGAISSTAAALITARAKDIHFTEILRLQKSTNSKMLHPSKYGVEIVTPAEYEKVGIAFVVSGTYKNLPEEFQIWVSTFSVSIDNKGTKSTKYWPQEKANTENGKWYCKVNDIGGKPGESKEFLVLVVGPEGQTLFNYFKEAGTEKKIWPAIQNITSDVLEVATGKVIVK